MDNPRGVRVESMLRSSHTSDENSPELPRHDLSTRFCCMSPTRRYSKLFEGLFLQCRNTMRIPAAPVTQSDGQTYEGEENTTTKRKLHMTYFLSLQMEIYAK